MPQPSSPHSSLPHPVLITPVTETEPKEEDKPNPVSAAASFGDPHA